jgi:hypothetical protein
MILDEPSFVSIVQDLLIIQILIVKGKVIEKKQTKI